MDIVIIVNIIVETETKGWLQEVYGTRKTWSRGLKDVSSETWRWDKSQSGEEVQDECSSLRGGRGSDGGRERERGDCRTQESWRKQEAPTARVVFEVCVGLWELEWVVGETDYEEERGECNSSIKKEHFNHFKNLTLHLK